MQVAQLGKSSAVLCGWAGLGCRCRVLQVPVLAEDVLLQHPVLAENAVHMSMHPCLALLQAQKDAEADTGCCSCHSLPGRQGDNNSVICPPFNYCSCIPQLSRFAGRAQDLRKQGSRPVTLAQGHVINMFSSMFSSM